MTRSLVLAAALSCAALLASPALAADAAALTFGWGDLLVEAERQAAPYVVAVVGALATLALKRFAPFLGLFVTQGFIDKLVANALDYGINATEGAAKGKVLSVPVGSAVLATAVQRALEGGSRYLVREAGGPAGIAEKLFRAMRLDENATATEVLAAVIAELRAKAA